MYFVHVWKSCGMKMENVRFVWTSQFIEENATELLGSLQKGEVRGQTGAGCTTLPQLAA